MDRHVCTPGHHCARTHQCLTTRLFQTLVSLLFLWGVISSAWAQAEDFPSRFEAATQAAQSGDYQTALERLEALKTDFPDHLAVRNNLAATLMQLEQYDRAQQELEAALAEIPQVRVLRENLAQVYAYQSQQAYQAVFDTELRQPDPKWELSAQTEMQTVENRTLHQLEQAMQTVVNRTESWRKAWAGQNLQAYLNFYVSDFLPDDHKTHQAWVANREASLSRPEFIRITLSDIQAIPLGHQSIQVSFDQAYQSDFFRDQVRKKLIWHLQENGQWRIALEEVINVSQ
ncbi:MAG: tetratricopeptide repeat protein [Hydrogenovibrio sp.]|nr:tetratricopeptide repeat protein [Hydrogenovibrio sp.]